MLEAEVPSDIDLCNDNPLVSDNLQEGQENLLGEQGDNALLSDACTNSKAHNNCTVLKSIRLDISFKSPSHTGLMTSELVCLTFCIEMADEFARSHLLKSFQARVNFGVAIIQLRSFLNLAYFVLVCLVPQL
jgi:hypothetical protein